MKDIKLNSIYFENDIEFPERGYVWTDRESEIEIFRDMGMVQASVSKARKKIAWISEPHNVCSDPYDIARYSWRDFDAIFTHDKRLIKDLEGVEIPVNYCTQGGCWVYEPGMHPKTKNVSIVVSEKNYCLGHSLRHQIVQAFVDKMDVMGRGYRFIEQKTEGHKDYRFSIIVENNRIPGYFTEKIIDAFACGSVPVYWGDPEIGEFFDMDGILTFSNLEDLQKVLEDCNEETYNLMLPHIEENYRRYPEYINVHELLWNAGLQSLLNEWGY